MSGGSNNPSGEHLLSFVHRIERLNEEMDNLKADRKEVYGEAGSVGFDTTAIRQIVTERRRKAKNPDDYAAHNATVDLYRQSIEQAEASLSRAPAPARAREATDSAPDARASSERAKAGGGPIPSPSPATPDTAHEAEPSPAASSPAAVSAPSYPQGARLPATDPAADETGDPQPAAGPSLEPTFTAGDRYAREGWQAFQKGKGRDDHGYLSKDRVEGFQRGWDLADRQAQRGQG